MAQNYSHIVIWNYPDRFLQSVDVSKIFLVDKQNVVKSILFIIEPSSDKRWSRLE